MSPSGSKIDLRTTQSILGSIPKMSCCPRLFIPNAWSGERVKIIFNININILSKTKGSNIFRFHLTKQTFSTLKYHPLDFTKM